MEGRSVQRSAPRRHGWRIAGGVVVALLVLLAGVRLALEPMLASRLRRALGSIEGMRGTFDHLELSVLHLSYTVHDLRLEKMPPDGHPLPFLNIERGDVGLYWTELVHGHLVGAIAVEAPKYYIIPSSGPSKPFDLRKALGKFMPLRLDRVEVRGGEILWVDVHSPDKPRLWLHGLDATLENFATRDALARGEPSILAASATLQRTGKLSVFASADPLAKALTFAGEARLRGLELVELGEFLAASTGFTPTQGVLDVSARFVAKDGHLTGALRPVIKNPSVQQAKPGLGEKIKAALADASLKILSDRVPGRNAVVTTIPLQGDLSSPKLQLWPTFMGILRNAFVTGLADSLTSLSPRGGSGGERSGGQARRPSVRADHGASRR